MGFAGPRRIDGSTNKKLRKQAKTLIKQEGWRGSKNKKNKVNPGKLGIALKPYENHCFRTSRVNWEMCSLSNSRP